MKWTQVFVLAFMAFQQACAIQEYVEPSFKFKALNADNFGILSDGNDDALKEYSILYSNDNTQPLSQKKMVKLIKIQDDQANTLVKREKKPKLGRSTSSPASISVESAHHSVPHSASSTAAPATANKMKSFFKGKGGKIAAGAVLATAAAGAITGVAIHHHKMKNKENQHAQQFGDGSQQPEMVKRQEIEPFMKRAKMPKGKGFALLAGGAAIGATGMHLYHKSGTSPAADPNAAAAGPPPLPAK